MPEPRKLSHSPLVVATHNAGKHGEIASLLKRYVADTRSAAELDLPEPDETGTTFVENAVLKAEAAAHLSGLPALADDSGLSVAALDGAPGIYSARWAIRGDGKRDFSYAMAKVWQEMTKRDPDNRRAWFVCTLALAWPDGHVETVEGTVDGTLVWPPRGNRGFGYDPIFLPDGYDITFGEMAPDQKHAISHRAVAFEKLIARCLTPA